MRVDTRKGLLALAAALGVTATAQASDSHFKYVYINFVSVDVDYSQSFVNAEGERIGQLASDRDSGLEIAGAVGANDGWHVFGLYHMADQKLDFSGGAIAIEPPIEGGDLKGSFEVTRWRLGLGRAMPMAPHWTVYGRVSYDNSKVSSMKLGDIKLGSSSDSGIGGEAGALYTPSPRIVLAGWLRYTSVGEASSKVNDDEFNLEFDYDVLLGIQGRYSFTPRFAVQAGYETGAVSTLNIGGRFNF